MRLSTAEQDWAQVAPQSVIDAGHDWAVETELQPFFYLPFGHSEDVASQEPSERSIGASGSLICRMPKDTATSCGASGVSLIETRFSGAR